MTAPSPDPDLLAAVTDVGDALRGLVDASVLTTVPAAELSAVAADLRAATARLAVAQRPVTQLPALDDPVAFRRVVVTGSIATADAPDTVLVEARGVFVAPRADRSAEYFGAITDASGRHAPPGRPTDATALG